VLTALSAILGVDENALFEKAGARVPEAPSPSTIEQALATLDPELAEGTTFGQAEPARAEAPSPASPSAAAEAPRSDLGPTAGAVPAHELDARSAEERAAPSLGRAAAAAAPEAADAATWVTPPNEASYVEDGPQRQLYRVRSLATAVALVALVIAFLWALSEGLGALSDWWDGFFGSLRL